MFLFLSHYSIVINFYLRLMSELFPLIFGIFLIQVLYRKDVKTAIDATAYTFHHDYPIELLFILVEMDPTVNCFY